MTIARALVVTILVAGVAAAPARAQSVEAESLFREGKRLLLDGKIREACEKLDASERLEPTVGTELNLADCRELNDQLASAWVTFRKAAANAKRAGNDAKREAEARRRASRLEPRLSYLTISVPIDTRVAGLAVARNGAAVDAELWNQKVPVDSGEYEVVASAPGRVAWRRKIGIHDEGQTAKLEIPPLETKAKTAAPTAEAPASEGDATSVEAPAPRPSRLTPRRKLAIIGAAARVAVLGGSTFLALHADSVEQQANKLCPNQICPDPNGLILNSNARRAALFANIGFGVGGAAVAGAVVLWFSGKPKPFREEVSIVPSFDGLHLVGHF